MAKVFCIFEENHGFIGVATTPNATAHWLIDSSWVDKMTDYYHDGEMESVPLEEVVPDSYMGEWEKLVHRPGGRERNRISGKTRHPNGRRGTCGRGRRFTSARKVRVRNHPIFCGLDVSRLNKDLTFLENVI